MPFVTAFALGISIIVVLTIIEGRKDRRRHSPIRRRRPAHNWIDASEGIRFDQPIHAGSFRHDHHHGSTDTGSTHTHGHHHGHDTGHHGGGFDSGGHGHH